MLWSCVSKVEGRPDWRTVYRLRYLCHWTWDIMQKDQVYDLIKAKIGKDGDIIQRENRKNASEWKNATTLPNYIIFLHPSAAFISLKYSQFSSYLLLSCMWKGKASWILISISSSMTVPFFLLDTSTNS